MDILIIFVVSFIIILLSRWLVAVIYMAGKYDGKFELAEKLVEKGIVQYISNLEGVHITSDKWPDSMSRPENHVTVHRHWKWSLK